MSAPANRYRLVLVRHGQSEYTIQNRFCGFAHDADLTGEGITEARRAGQLLKDNDLDIDFIFTSVLKRAIKTVYHIQDVLDCHWVPVVKTWRLNERHYGTLQGLNRVETAEEYGEAQVKKWRRSYDCRPPPIDESDSRWPGHSRQYAAMDLGFIPNSESLKDTIERTLPCWHDQIVPILRAGNVVLISAHGNSLRGIVKYLDRISDKDIITLEIPAAIPLVYDLDSDFNVVRRFYLAVDEEVAAAEAKMSALNKSK